MSNQNKIRITDVIAEIRKGSWEEAQKLFQQMGNYSKWEWLTTRLIAMNDPKIIKKAVQLDLARIDNHQLPKAAEVSLEMLKTCMDLVDDRNPINKYNNKLGPKLTESAAKAGLLDVLDYLKEIGAEFNFGPSMVALENDNLEVFQWLEKNVPEKVYYRYDFRSPQPTFECFKYLYSKGYQPSYSNYKNAHESESDTEYADWLQSINCPGTIDRGSDVPEDYQEKFEMGPLDPGDFSWILKLIQEKRLPEINRDLYWTPPILNILEELLEYPNLIESEQSDGLLDYLFKYLGSQKSIMKYFSCSSIYEILINYSTQRTLELIQQMGLDKYRIAQLYSIYRNECCLIPCEEEEIATFHKNQRIIRQLEPQVDWGYMFLVDLNDWIALEGSYQASEFVRKIEELWKLYERRIPQLLDPKNKEEWEKITEDPWKDEMHDFLYSLKIWD